jgi:virginiamycin A acetyltransferase
LRRILRGIRRRLLPPPSLYTNRQLQYAAHEIGDWTYGRPIILDWGDGSRLKIGKFCSIARDVKILVGGEHRPEWVTTYPFQELWTGAEPSLGSITSRSKGDVIIQNDVWIGTGAIILSGVTICNGAVVGAGSVVTKDVPAYAIVAGNPAQLIRMRFEASTIERLQRIAWWEWSLEKISEAWPLLMSPDVRSFVVKYDVLDSDL